MPAALDVNWGEVKLLAQMVGVLEAARRMGISEDAVKQRSSREGWLKDLPRSQPLPPSVRKAVTGVTSAPQAAINYLKDLLVKTRTNHAKVALVASEELARVAETAPTQLLEPEKAGVLLTHAKHASLAGGWADQAPVAKVNLTVTATQEPVTLEAEIVEDDPLAGF